MENPSQMKRRASLLLISLASIFFCSGSEAAAPNAGPSCPSIATAHFEIKISPWMNLHHFLFEWARATTPAAAGDRRPPVDVAEKGSATLSQAQSKAWQEALDYYRQNLVEKNLTFSADLRELKPLLAAADCAAPSNASATPAQRAWLAQLEGAMPVYRAHWWPAHLEADRAFLARLEPLVRSHEGALVRRLSEIYGGSWPVSRLRVDISFYAGSFGAYTTNRPDHVVLGPNGADKEGLGAIDTLFHESSHVESLESPLKEALALAFAGSEPPRDLDHVIQFFTPSWLLRASLGEKDAAAFRPLAERLGLYDRLPVWNEYRRALEIPWTAFLRGEISREKALSEIAVNLASRPAGSADRKTIGEDP